MADSAKRTGILYTVFKKVLQANSR
jgi:hypothetical protein